MNTQQPIHVAGQKPMDSLAAALDADSYNWMVELYPDFVSAIEQALAQGIKPGQIRRFVFTHTGRLELAKRCEQCALHLERMKEQ